MIEHEINRLLYKAKSDKNLREELLSAKEAADPTREFCELAQKNGYEIYLGELFSYGLTMNDSKLRATNGGGSFEIDGWNDIIDNIFDELLTY